MPTPLVYVVVLTNHHEVDTLACLESLAQVKYENFKTILLDNGSPDATVARFQTQYPTIQLVRLQENLGYAGNNNIGIQFALEHGAEWVYLINDDVVLDADCIDILISAGQADPLVGVLGPLVYHFDEPNVIQSAGGVLGKYWVSQHLGKDEPDQGQFTLPQVVEWISGCAIMVRREVIEQVGMLDASYFLYWEETEWCLRAGRAGWQNLLVPQAKLWHKGVQRNYAPKPYVTYYLTRNHLLTLAKHHAPFRVRMYTWLQILRTLFSWTIKPQWRHKREHRDAMWKGLVDYLRGHFGPLAL